MAESIAVGIATIIVLGIAAQWLGWRLRLPSILLLLACGFLAGPGRLGLVDPDAIFGDLLLPLVGVSVALLLFEGALTLHLPELGKHGGVAAKLVTLGAVVTWALAGLAAWALLGLEPKLAVLCGAILTVTGPTVVLPLLRQIRPTGPAGSILKWEGILIDPVGAVLAVLVFEGILHDSGVGAAAAGIAKTILCGGLFGVAAAYALAEMLRRYWVPDHLHSPVALALAVGTYVATNQFQHEAGLLSVTVMGAILANQKRVDVHHILEFKENLRVLIISTIFIVLAARVRMEDLRLLEPASFVFVAILILVVRPACVAACARGSELGRADRIFLCAMAPRGVVAAAVTAVFALRLEETGLADAARLVPIVFLVIVGTVAVYGLGAGPLAHRLGLARASPQGILVVGAHRLARDLAKALHELDVRVLVADTNLRAVAKARIDGLPGYHGNVMSEKADGELDLPGIGRLFAMTSNDEVNALCALHFSHLFGRGEVYQLAPREAREEQRSRSRGRTLFSDEATYRVLWDRHATGAAFKATLLTEQFGFDDWRKEHGEDALPLLTVEDGKVAVATVDRPFEPGPGQTLLALVP